jgi:hypothetical protein
MPSVVDDEASKRSMEREGRGGSVCLLMRSQEVFFPCCLLPTQVTAKAPRAPRGR